MLTRVLSMVMVVVASVALGLGQAVTPPSPVLIPGVAEPPEMKTPAKVLPTPSITDEAFWQLAKQATPKGFTEATLPALNNFIEAHPDYADGYYWRANVYICNRTPPDLGDAASDLQNALLHKSSGSPAFDASDTLALLARVNTAEGKYDTALNLLERALMSKLSSADQIFNISGIAPEHSSDFCTWNLTDLHILESHAPKDWRPLALEGLYYEFFTTFNEQYYGPAAAAFQNAALVNPRTPIVPYLQGELQMHAAFWTKRAWASNASRDDIYRSALPYFTKAILDDPRFEPAYAARAEAYLELKISRLAIKDFDAVLSLQPDDDTAHSDRGLANADVGKYYDAISDYSDAIRRKHNGDVYLPTLYENRGIAYTAVQDFRRAIDDYTSAIALQIETQVPLWSLSQFRNLYPEYAAVSDDVLLSKLNRQFAPQYEASAFKKQMTEENGKWGVSLLEDLYEKRGDAYLSIGDFGHGIRDYQRIFVGMPDYGKFIDRWHPLGRFGDDRKYYIDLKASEPFSTPYPRLWVKSEEVKRSVVMQLELNCADHKIRSPEVAEYDPKGNEVNSDSNDVWSEIIPDSIGETVWNGVCRNGPENVRH